MTMGTTERLSTGAIGPADDAGAIGVATPDDRRGVATVLLQAAIQADRASTAIDAAIAVLRQSAVGKIDDPFMFRDIATMKVRLHAAEAAIRRAERRIDMTAQTATGDASADVAVAEAGVLAAEAATLAADTLAQWAGDNVHPATEIEDASRDKEATVHEAMPWRLHAIGDHVVNGIALPQRRL